MGYTEKESFYRDRYRILRKLGEGGSSVVYMAMDEKERRPVTIKCLKMGSANSEQLKKLSEGETNLLSKLSHRGIPNLIAVYDDAVVMEYVPGNSLEKVLTKKGRFSERETAAIAMEVLEILEYLHDLENPVIYRDLKPANIMLRPDGHIALIDFGTARVMEKDGDADTLNLGTSGFAAPEQYGNLGQTDPRTDIYCLGKTLLLLLGGKCCPEFMEIIEKCTMPDREDRFESCGQVKAALKKYPVKVLIHKAGRGLKLAAGSALVAGAISFALIHYDAVRSYAAEDARDRLPAVQERLGVAGLRLREILEERFGVEFAYSGDMIGADETGKVKE
jgi:serine/threonine-protein kinase